MVGSSSYTLTRYYYDSRVHLVPEIDGIRMITTESCEFLQKVPGLYFPRPALGIEKLINVNQMPPSLFSGLALPPQRQYLLMLLTSWSKNHQKRMIIYSL